MIALQQVVNWQTQEVIKPMQRWKAWARAVNIWNAKEKNTLAIMLQVLMGGCVSTADDHPQNMPSLPQSNTLSKAAKFQLQKYISQTLFLVSWLGVFLFVQVCLFACCLVGFLGGGFLVFWVFSCFVFEGFVLFSVFYFPSFCLLPHLQKKC